MYRILLWVVLVLSTIAPCCHADLLRNGNFQQNLTNWTRDFGASSTDSAGRPGGNNPWRVCCDHDSAGISQQVPVSPGMYRLHMEGYYLLPYAKSSITLTNAYIRFIILADGNEVASRTFTASGNPAYPTWTPWTLAGVDWSGTASQSVGVRIVMQNLYITGTYGREGYGVCLDDVSLNAVPEPGGFAAMFSALGFMTAGCGRRIFLLRKRLP